MTSPDPSRHYADLHCGICLSEYNDPRALPCLHTFCLGCLVGMAAANSSTRGGGGGGGRLTCPSCREICHTEPATLRRNFHVTRWQEVRPLLTLGAGAVDAVVGRARAELARLPAESDLRRAARRRRQELRQLRTRMHALEVLFAGVEAAVEREREAVRARFEAAKEALQSGRRWACDGLDRRSISERLIDCVDSQRRQELPTLMDQFHAVCPEPPTVDDQPPPPRQRQMRLPTVSQARSSLLAQLVMKHGGDGGSRGSELDVSVVELSDVEEEPVPM